MKNQTSIKLFTLAMDCRKNAKDCTRYNAPDAAKTWHTKAFAYLNAYRISTGKDKGRI